jgi:broad specificity phosphatase PhoE
VREPLRLVLARHGQTPSNVAKLLDTVLPGPGLTELGRAQAAALGEELATGTPVTALYCSAAARARETAGLVGSVLGLEPEVVDGLHEVQVGELEGRNDDAAIAAFREVFEQWQAGELGVAYPGGESGRDLLTRWHAGVAGIRERHAGGGTVVVVGHGAAVRLAAADLVAGRGVPPAESNHLDNCGRVVVSARDDGPPDWELEAWLSAVPGGLPSTHDVTGG